MRRLIPSLLLAIMTVGAGVAAYFAVRDSTTPSDAVASALVNSLQLKSADLNLSIGIDEGGGTGSITSVGATSFATGATTQDMQIVSGNERVGEHIVSNGSKIYVNIDGGVIGQIVPGKSWVDLPSGQSAATSLSGGTGAVNATAILRVLSAPGNDVVDLGASQVNGRGVHLYSVHLTKAQINQDIASEHLPQFVRQEVAGVHIPAIAYTLAINGMNQLTQLKATLHLRAGGQHVTEHLTEGFSHYGTHVTVTTPPSGEVVPFERFLQIAQEKNAHVTI